MTSVKTKITLHSLLTKADPQQFKIASTGPICVQLDDRDSDDCYPGFCNIHLRMSDPNSSEFILTLSNVPSDDDVKELVAELDGIWESTHNGEKLTLELPVSDFTAISELAKAIRNVVGRGKRYDDPNWKWITKRIGHSLERFARTLAKAKKGTRIAKPPEIPVNRS